MELFEIIQILKENGLTGYKIAEDTGLTQVGIDKILNGVSKKPQQKTIKVLESYIRNNFKKLTANEASNRNEPVSFNENDLLKVKLQYAEEKIKLLESQNTFLLEVVAKKLDNLPIQELKELHEEMTRKILLKELKERKSKISRETTTTTDKTKKGH